MNISIKFLHNKPVLSLHYNGNIKVVGTKICHRLKLFTPCNQMHSKKKKYSAMKKI